VRRSCAQVGIAAAVVLFCSKGAATGELI
jgi:hypothetical protein